MTNSEVIGMLKEMQEKTASTMGFFCWPCHTTLGDQRTARIQDR